MTDPAIIEAAEIDAAAEEVQIVMEALPRMFSGSTLMPVDLLMHALGVLRRLASERRGTDMTAAKKPNDR